MLDSEGTLLNIADVVGGRGEKAWVYNYSRPIANLGRADARLQCNICHRVFQIRNHSLTTIETHLKVRIKCLADNVD